MKRRDNVGQTRTRTPAQIARQERAYMLSAQGKTVREIAADLHCNKDTVARDIKAEGERRFRQIEERHSGPGWNDIIEGFMDKIRDGEVFNLQTQRRTYSVKEAAEVLGISTAAVYEAVRRGDIPSLKFGSRIVIPKVQLERLLDGK